MSEIGAARAARADIGRLRVTRWHVKEFVTMSHSVAVTKASSGAAVIAATVAADLLLVAVLASQRGFAGLASGLDGHAGASYFEGGVMLITVLVMNYSTLRLYRTTQPSARASQRGARAVHAGGQPVRAGPTRFDRYDLLTGLPSRHVLNEAIAQRLYSGEGVALLLCQLNNMGAFRAANGDDLADEVLKQAALRLRTTVGAIGFTASSIARMDTDTFATLTPTAHGEFVEAIALKVREALSEPYVAAARLFDIDVTCGIALAPDHAATTDGLARAAQTALEQAKVAGGKAWRFYSPSLEADRLVAAQLRDELPDAIRNRAIVPYYQPIVDLQTGRTVKLEVLARWVHPTLGVIGPDTFIPIAESLGLSGALTHALLQRVSEDSHLREDLVFALNVSPDQLSGIIRLLTQDSARPAGALTSKRLEVELTERALTGDIDVVREVLRVLQSVGTRVSLDDFGVGASNIFNLCELPFDCIKIDKRFVHGLLCDLRAAACVATIIGLGEKLGVEVVAMGIEDEKTMELLIGMGCRFGQGYFFSRPVSACDLPALLDVHPALPAPRAR